MKTFREFILEANKHNILDGRNYFVLEVNFPESGREEEKRRWDAANKRRNALEDPSSVIIGTGGRDKNGVQTYSLKNAALRKQQQKNRASRLSDIDSDLDPEQKKRGKKKVSLIGPGDKNVSPSIQGREKEAHHLTKIADSAKEFAGLSPEERKVKREKDAKVGKFHGSDPRNIAQTDGPEGGTGIPHRGESGYHSGQKPVGKGGSIQDFGSEKEIVAVKLGIRRRGFSALAKLRKEKGLLSPIQQKGKELASRMSTAYDKKVDDATT